MTNEQNIIIINLTENHIQTPICDHHIKILCVDMCKRERIIQKKN